MSQSYVHIRLRRDTAANWSLNNPILLVGEPGLESDTRKLKFGDGTTPWNSLNYSSIDVGDNLVLETIDDRVAALIKAGDNISITYNDNLDILTIGATGLQLAGDYAILVNGKIPSSQLPSYVDDVLEYNNLASLPVSGETGKIYVTLDSNKTYRWGGSAYIEISASPGSTDSVAEGSVNLYYTNARASAAAPVQSVAGRTGTVTLTKSDVGLSNVDNTSDANKPVSTAQAAADSAVASAAASDATTKANAAQAHAVQRANHTGTQLSSTISDFNTAAGAAAPVQSVAGRTGSVVLNSEDIQDFSSAVSDELNTQIASGSGILIEYDNNTDIVTISSTVTKATIGLGSVDNTSDLNKPISSATQIALDLKAPINNPTFTGTVNGITKSMVGLGNVDNTSDINKPVSTAQAAADTAVQNAAASDATTKANAAQAAAAIDATNKSSAAQAYAVQRVNHTGTQSIGTIEGLQTALDSKQPSGTYATLVNGTVPSSQLPSYVDDVLEYANLVSFPVSGETGKIYVSLDSNKTYRWGGSSYVEISSSPGTTDSVPEGTTNLYYSDERASAAAPVQSVAGKIGEVELDKEDVGLINVDDTSDMDKPVSYAQQEADEAVQLAAEIDASTKADAAKDYAIQRANHTGYQSIETISGLQTALDNKQVVGDYATLVNNKVPAIQLPSTDSINEGSSNLYYTNARASAAAPVQSVAGRTGTVTLTKSDVGLSNVDNTSDANKPVSTAQAAADSAVASAAAADATTKANAAQAYAVQRGNHTGTQAISTVTGLQDALNSKLSIEDLNTDIVAGGGIGVNYNNVNGTLSVYATNEVYITSLGSVSGTVALNYDPTTRSIQTLTLNGTTTTFTKGSGWPLVSGTSVDIVLKITVTSATTIVWSIVNEWYNQPNAGALSTGTHLFILRAMGNSVIEGHYIGAKTN